MIYPIFCVLCVIFSVFPGSSQEDGPDLFSTSGSTYNSLYKSDGESWCSEHCQQTENTPSDKCQASCVQTLDKLRTIPKKWTDESAAIGEGGEPSVVVEACVRQTCLSLRGEARKRCFVSCGHKDGIRKRWLDPLNYGVTQKRATPPNTANNFMVCLRTFCHDGLSDTCSNICKKDDEGKPGFSRSRKSWIDTTYMCKLFCYGEESVMTFDRCVHRCAFTIGKNYRIEK